MKRIVGVLLLFIGCFAPRDASAQYSAVNEALSLTGAGYVSIPWANAFNGQLNQIGMFSIDAWVSPSSLSGYMTVVGNDYVVGYWLGVTPTGKIRFYPRGGLYYDSPGSIPSGQWSHIAVSFNARKQTLSFYINGALNGSVSVPQGGVGSVTGGDLRIGADRSGGSPAYYWSGMIDEVRLWAEEINFSTAVGLLYRVPHAVYNGRYGKYLIAGWRLNGSETGIDNQFNGTLTGTSSYASTPMPPHYARICASFSNLQPLAAAGTDDYFAIPSSSGNSLVQNYTLECWVKPTSTGGSPTYQTFISKGSQYAGAWSYWVGLNKANSKVRFVPNGDFTDGLESSTTMPLNQWTHVTARYLVSGNTRTATLFFNDVVVGTKSYSRDATPNQNAVLIGRADYAGTPVNGYGLSGFLDEVRIWNTARSNTEIINAYRMELTGPVTNLTSAYHFDGDILDASGNGNNGAHTLAASADVTFNDASDLPAIPTVQVLLPNGGETWFTGSTRSVQWASSGLQNVRIELSRDGGQTYGEVLTPSTPAATGAFNWLVSGPVTATARVRVTTTTPTSLSDESDKNFSIEDPPPTLSATPSSLTFAAAQGGVLPPSQRIRLKNTGGGTLSWSASPGATAWLSLNPTAGTANTDSFDVSILDSNLPENSYNAVMTITGNFSNSPVTIPVVYRVTKKLIFSISGRVTIGSTPLANIVIPIFGDVNTSATTDINGYYSATGLPQGDYALAPSNPFYDFTPASRNYAPLNSNVTDADFNGRSKRGRAMLRYREGWNLMSLPLNPDITDLGLLLPAAKLPAYLFDPAKGYVETTTVGSNKMVFWVNCSRTDSTEISGELLPAVQHSVSSSYGGWNLIGAPSGPASVAAMEQFPSGLVVAIYEYDPLFGYLPPIDGQFRPGRGYFLKAAGDGSVRITAESAFAPIVFRPSLRFPGAAVLWDPPPPPPSSR